MSYQEEYRQKLTTADEAVKAVKSGDWVDYGWSVCSADALDKALRCVLEQFYPSLRSVHLTDYKVRVLDGSDATASRVRVLITSSDGADSWSTIGVSSDIIKASFLALSDSIEYKLFKDRYTKEVKRWA